MLSRVTMESAYSFEQVKQDDEHFKIVSHQFNTVIAPIYGDQSEALKKIASGTDRTCEVLIEKTSRCVAGILVYKLEPTEEFSHHGINKAFELKTLFVVDAATQSGRGIGTRLIDRIISLATNQKFNFVAVTVSDEKPESQNFFLKKNFNKIATFSDKYKAGANETLYALNCNKP